ncbi:MAG TPA: BTAD domain-containing putative transcriptional regulator [Pseudonocardiaceae bacterium]|nr:BTAD domain-containing putative transcriptional regulator [Pseudonocardiaceae bacterium]
MTEGVRFRLLGDLEVTSGDQRLPVGRRRERCLLGLLLLTPNTAVPTARLVDLLWDGEPPPTAAAALHTHVSRLRSAVGHGIHLRHAGDQGYVAEVDPRTVDVHRFTSLVEGARTVHDPERRAALLRSALDLWRGPLLRDCASDHLRDRLSVDLDELRLTATELAVDSELACGRHRDLIAELTRLTTEHPLRERFWGQLALALYRGDRQADALAALARARTRLADDLGIDPGPHLTQLQEQILAADPALLLTAEAAHHQLPRDIAEFTGRAAELAALCARGTGTAPAIHAVIGMAGVGKTRLAVRAAHQLADAFPDAQLWADLRGHDPDQPPTDPATVLERFLHALGVPIHEIPADPDARAALYRDRLAGRRALVVLDDAADENQVRPLLPAGATCHVLITSRHSLTGLDGVHTHTLDVFTTDDAVALLRRDVGDRRVATEPGMAERVADLCGHLPIAVALAARHLRNRPAWRLRDMVTRLADENRRLTTLSTHSRAVRPAFDLSYRALPEPHRHLFRLLALHPGQDVSAASAAALADIPVATADAILESLYDEHLLQESAPGRYRMHDLVRLYAAELTAHHDTPAARQAAFGRVVDHYLRCAEQATRLVHPTEARRLGPPRPAGPGDPTTTADAHAWAEREYTNLLAIVSRAADDTDDTARLAVRLVLALYRPLANRGLSTGRIALNRVAARAAHRIGDRRGEAQALEDLGSLCAQVGLFDESLTATTAALTLWTELDDTTGQQACTGDLGNTYRLLGELDLAADHLHRGLAIAEAAGNTAGQASTLNFLGLVHQDMSRYREACAMHRDSHRRYQALGNVLGAAIAQANLGWAEQRSGDAAGAITHHEAALRDFRGLGDEYNAAEQLWALGQAHHALGHPDSARTHWHAAIAALRAIGLVDTDEAETLLHQPVPDTPEIIRLNT